MKKGKAVKNINEPLEKSIKELAISIYKTSDLFDSKLNSLDKITSALIFLISVVTVALPFFYAIYLLVEKSI